VEDREREMAQAAHPDPEAPGYRAPDPAGLSALWRRALSSREMAAYRAALLLPGQPNQAIRAAILDDLTTYHRLPPDECVRRCRHWEQWSVQEWQARPRDSRAAIAEFYNSVQSWSFDLAWYAYLQAEGAVYPTSVVAATAIQERLTGHLRCLDFGAGAGDLAHLLLALGHEATLADASRPLLEFARWRLDRRGQHPPCLDLNDTALPPEAYDVVFAKDVLVHVPDFAEAVAALHRSLRPGGLLFATFDTRPPSPENAWHLYEDDVPLRRTLQDLGFEQVARLDRFLFIYRRVEPVGLPHLARRARNAILLSPARRLARDGKATARRLLGR
jgi:2-polyprenyl-3-methyl-5-hydroxy-6-metoxy-1,4-benzoquinol methylase